VRDSRLRKTTQRKPLKGPPWAGLSGLCCSDDLFRRLLHVYLDEGALLIGEGEVDSGAAVFIRGHASYQGRIHPHRFGRAVSRGCELNKLHGGIGLWLQRLSFAQAILVLSAPPLHSFRPPAKVPLLFLPEQLPALTAYGFAPPGAGVPSP